MRFEEYFSLEAIVSDLIRWRVKGKGTVGADGRRDVEKVLPPRKAWSRAGVKARKGVYPEVVRRQSIWRRVMRLCNSESLGETEWGQNLLSLVKEVRETVMRGTVNFEKPRMIRISKGYKDGVQQFRDVASFDRLSDRVILSRATVYVRDMLEGVLVDCCYSFRRDPNMSHQLAIARLQDWRREHANGSMFVAECDIKKFFDNISHDVVRRCWKKIGFDQVADKLLEAYLAVYSNSSAERRGLPQGGSFSTVLANLVLHEADDAVKRIQCENLFYARYCDDVVVAHTDESVCRAALVAYETALSDLELPIHPVESFVYCPVDRTATTYYTTKSKGPFRWSESAVGEINCAPWVSFLGSQVRYDGETRIRKESVEKHIRSLGRETAKAVREIKKGNACGASAWFARFRNRLIAKGVGYVTAKVKDCHLCWAGAFTRVTDCADTQIQMRRLDRVREGMLCKVWRMLPKSCVKKRRCYKGKPFSYYGFLYKATRPTNMAYRNRVLLPYSEL